MAKADSYDQRYFDNLYGNSHKQTFVDKQRDNRIINVLKKNNFVGNILEIGCGFGFFLNKISNSFHNTKIYGTDISKEAIKFAKELNPKGQFVAESVLNGISFNEKFNAILAVNVMEHLEDPKKALETIFSHLNKDGIFIAHLPLINNNFNRFIYSFTYAKDKTHIYKPTAKEFIKLCEEVGFETLEDLYSPFFGNPLWKILKPHPAFMGVFKKK